MACTAYSVEWREASCFRHESLEWTNRSLTRLDHRGVLDGRVCCRVSVIFHRSLDSGLILDTFSSVYYLYTLIRRPRMILDFSLTLLFNHLVLTTYYAAALPTSLFFWIVMIASAALMVIAAEQLCVKREMSDGLAVVTNNEADEMEMGDLLRRD